MYFIQSILQIFFPVIFSTSPLLLFFLLLFFLLPHCYFLSCYIFSCYFFSCYFFSVTFFPVTFFPTIMTDSPAFLTRPPNIAHSAWMHGTLWNAIFASLIASEIDVIDTLRFNNDVDYLYRLATVLEMRLNHEYWCEPECTWQTNSINTATSWQLGFQTLERYWASFQVTRLSQCNQFFQPGRLLEWRVFHFFIYLFFWGGGGGVGGGGGGVVGAQLQCIYYLVLYTDLKAAEGN